LLLIELLVGILYLYRVSGKKTERFELLRNIILIYTVLSGAK